MDSDEVRQRWAERSGEFSPQYYAYYGPNEASRALRGLLDDHVGPDASVLELGCSAGRHLAHLHDHGYDDLTGIDLNPDAFDVLATEYPALDETGTFHTGAIEDIVPEFDDDAFDAVYSVETLQHVPPDDAWVFEDLVRVAADLLVTVEVEGSEADRAGEGEAVNYVDDGVPLFYRDWCDVFADHGATELDSWELERDTVRVFRPDD
jgi:SAM-dependent methyltransferase